MRLTDHPEVAIFPEKRFALAQPRGHVDGPLVELYGRAMAYHPDWQPGFTEVWDVTLSAAIDLLPRDIARLKEPEIETLEHLAGSATLVIMDRPLVRVALDLYAHLVRPLGRIIVPVASHEEACKTLGIREIPLLT